MEGLGVVGARVGPPSYQEKAEYMDRDTEAGSGVHQIVYSGIR